MEGKLKMENKNIKNIILALLFFLVLTYVVQAAPMTPSEIINEKNLSKC